MYRLSSHAYDWWRSFGLIAVLTVALLFGCGSDGGKTGTGGAAAAAVERPAVADRAAPAEDPAAARGRPAEVAALRASNPAARPARAATARAAVAPAAPRDRAARADAVAAPGPAARAATKAAQARGATRTAARADAVAAPDLAARAAARAAPADAAGASGAGGAAGSGGASGAGGAAGSGGASGAGGAAGSGSGGASGDAGQPTYCAGRYIGGINRLYVRKTPGGPTCFELSLSQGTGTQPAGLTLPQGYGLERATALPCAGGAPVATATAVTGVVESLGPSAGGFPESFLNVDVTLTFAADASVPQSETMRAENLPISGSCAF